MSALQDAIQPKMYMSHVQHMFLTLACLTICLASFTKCGANDQAISQTQKSIETRTRYLLLDQRIIAEQNNATLELGEITKHPQNPLFVEDMPWEKRFDNLYGNVIFDSTDNLYKCWYSPFIVDHSSKGMNQAERDVKRYRPPRNREMAICYATSKDGIKWTKPQLGLVEYEGSTANNIIWRGPHGAGITKDDQETDPNRRYKLIMQGVSTSFSRDGIHWQEPTKLKSIGKIAGDTHNNVFWDPATQTYVGITRTWGPLGRQVTRLTTKNFENWQNTGVIMEATEKSHQPYAMPVFLHGGIYLGLVAIHAQPPVDRVWTELAWSPDTVNWTRISPGTPLIPCSESILAYDYGCVYACAYPVFRDNEIRLYYGGSDYYHYGWRTGNLSLATLRPDGFAGYVQSDSSKSAVIKTTMIPFRGKPPRVSADVHDGGTLKISISGKNGVTVRPPIIIRKTVTDFELALPKELKSEAIQLSFEFDNAKIYSFSFAD